MVDTPATADERPDPWNNDRSLGEEIVSSAIQGTAAVGSVVGLILLVTRAWPQGTALPLIGALIYGATLIIAFAASALYHGIPQPRLKRFFRTVDHCTIFLLIAGTYTPITLVTLWHHSGWLLLLSVWSMAIIGIVLRLVRGARFHRFAIPLYLAMGWISVAWAKALYDATGLGAALLILAGGVAYTGGLLFYRWNGLRYSNALWHLCVVAGSACFFLAISLYVLPAST
ncbi:MAG TPA: hemolysin III family protein [Alphaproteobacteria bacterium]